MKIKSRTFKLVIYTLLTISIYFSMFSIVKVNAVTYEARIETAYYTTVKEAVDAATNGQVIVILSDANINQPLNINNKKITITSDQDKVYRITRTVATNFFFIEPTGDLTLENIIIDGGGITNKANYTMAFTRGKLNLLDGSIIQNSINNTSGSAVWIDGGILTLNGGKIINNQTDGLGAAIAFNSANETNKAYLYNGEISNNITNNDTINGAVNFSAGELHIKGNVIIKDNLHSKTNTFVDLFIASNKNIILDGDFTGNIGVYTNTTGSIDEYGKKFGENANNYTGSTNFYNNTDKYVLGAKSGNDLVWDTILWSVTTTPTLTSKGLLTGVGQLNATHLVTSEIPFLSLSDYNFVNEVTSPTLTTKGQIQYTLKDPYLQNVSILVETDETNHSSYSKMIVTVPTKNSVGKVEFTNLTFPGYVIEKVLPILSTSDYIVEMTKTPSIQEEGEVTYTYQDATYGDTILTFNLPKLDDVSYVRNYDVIPSSTQKGKIIVTNPSLPGMEIEINLPKLSTSDYSAAVTLAPTLIEEGKITYTYNDVTYGEIVIESTLPKLNDGGYIYTLNTKPTSTQVGKLVGTNPLFPGFEVEVELPLLSKNQYTINVLKTPTLLEEGKVAYKYKDITYGDVVIEVILPVAGDESYTFTIDSAPTVSKTGKLVGTNSATPDLELAVILPMLSIADYTVETPLAPTLLEKGVATYTYKVTTFGNIAINYSLPKLNDENYTYNVETKPTNNELGKLVGINPEFPGLEVAVELPKLSPLDYTVEITLTPTLTQEGKITYTYNDLTYGNHVIEYTLPKTSSSGYVFDFDTFPTVNTTCLVTITNPQYPGLEFIVELPKLSSESYTVKTIIAPTKLEQGKVTYTYQDQVLIVIEYQLPKLNDANYIYRVETKPTVNELGKLAGTNPLFPGVEVEIELSKLSASDYIFEVTKTPTLLEEGLVIYTYHDEAYGEVMIECTLPKIDGTGYTYSVETKPTVNEKGKLKGTNPSYPGVEVEVELAKLAPNDYKVEVTLAPTLLEEGKVAYTYKDEVYGEVIIECVLPKLDDKGYSYTLNQNPTAIKQGKLSATILTFPGVDIEVKLPKISPTDYMVELTKAPTLQEKGIINYQYKSTSYGNYAFDLDLPKLDVSEYTHNVVTPPTDSTTGVAVIGNANYPGLTLEVELPQLSKDNYQVEVVKTPNSKEEGKAIYTYHDPLKGDVQFEVTLPKTKPEVNNTNPWLIIIILILIVTGGTYYYLISKKKAKKVEA